MGAFWLLGLFSGYMLLAQPYHVISRNKLKSHFIISPLFILFSLLPLLFNYGHLILSKAPKCPILRPSLFSLYPVAEVDGMNEEVYIKELSFFPCRSYHKKQWHGCYGHQESRGSMLLKHLLKPFKPQISFDQPLSLMLTLYSFGITEYHCD